MSEFQEQQPKSTLRIYIESSGKFGPHEIDQLWQRMGENKSLYNQLLEIQGIALRNPSGAEVMLEKIRDDLNKGVI